MNYTINEQKSITLHGIKTVNFVWYFLIITIMLYDDSLWGMHLIWWIFWGIMLFWIFATPYDIPGQRNRKDSALQILRKRFASGKISIEEYHERKSILENDLLKQF